MNRALKDILAPPPRVSESEMWDRVATLDEFVRERAILHRGNPLACHLHYEEAAKYRFGAEWVKQVQVFKGQQVLKQHLENKWTY